MRRKRGRTRGVAGEAYEEEVLDLKLSRRQEKIYILIKLKELCKLCL